MASFRKLQNNLEYWKSVAPKDATHYAPRTRLFYKMQDDKWCVWHEKSEQWVSCKFSRPEVTVPKPKEKNNG